MTYEELIRDKRYMEHHTALERGYYSRKHQPKVEEYHGRFGNGYKVTSANFNSTQYRYVTYYVEKEC